MPHIPDTAGLPSSPTRPRQGTIPRPRATEQTTGAGAKARMGMLPLLSMAGYKPDQRLINAALGSNVEAQPRDTDMSRFEQPKFGR